MSKDTPEELEEQIKELMYNVVGMTYNTEKALILKKKLEEKKDTEEDKRR